MSHIYTIDIETTGIDPETSEIIEIGGVCQENKQSDFIDPLPAPAWMNFSELCKPSCSIPPENSAIHHITDWHVRDKASVKEIALSFVDGMDGSPIFAAHNAKFESGFLSPIFKEIGGEDFKPQWICTYKLAQKLFPTAPSFKNAALFYWLNLFAMAPDHWSAFFDKNQLHRAWPDAVITQEILLICLKYVSIEEAIEISSNPALLARVPFGKNRGVPWSEMDVGFLGWVLERDFGEDILHTARHHQTRLLMDGGES